MSESGTTDEPGIASPAADTSDDASAISATTARGIRWPLVGLVAGAALLVLLIGGVGLRALVAALPPGLGATPVTELKPGSCLREADAGLASYTVVPCFGSHAQQVIAPVDLSVSGNVFTQFSVMSTYSQAVCDRFLEYGLFVTPEVAAPATRANYTMHAFHVPTEADFKAGKVTALCSITPADGKPSTTNLYQAAP
jgi:hypothetical protein